MSRNLYDLLGLFVSVCFIMALKGLSSPKSARRGNLIGAFGATVATVLVFFEPGSSHHHIALILLINQRYDHLRFHHLLILLIMQHPVNNIL